MRALIAATLVLVGVLLSVPGSVAARQERVILDEDAFVSTVAGRILCVDSQS